MTRARGLALVAALAALGVIAWWFAWPRHPAVPARAEPASAIVAASRPLPSVSPSRPPSSSHAAPPAYLRHLDPAMEICRQPALDAKSLAEAMSAGSRIERYLEIQTEDLRQYVLQALRAGADEQSRLAGALLKGDIAAAAEVARATNDGRAYGIAWQACRGRGTAAVFRNAASAGNAQEMQGAIEREMEAASPSCDALSVERWAQLEPDNAVPWLEMLAEARARGDRAAAIDALYRAGLARRQDTGFAWLTGQVAAVLPADAPEGGRMLLLTDTLGRDSARPIGPGTAAVAKACSADETRDSNVRQQCERVAQLLVDRSATIFERMMGTKLAERLGVEVPMSSKALNGAMMKDADQFTLLMERAGACAALRELGDRFAERGRLGEWAAIEARLPRGKP